MANKTLTIPRASTTQDGYLSKDDWIIFAGEDTVPVLSFNLRTGDVVLVDTDVLSALGYVPASKEYVDSTSAQSGIIGAYRVKTTTGSPAPAVDPGAGRISFNYPTQGDATELFVSKITDNGFDATNIWTQIDAGRTLTLQRRTDSSLLARYTIVSVTDVMQFLRVAVTPVWSHGFPLGNNLEMAVAVSPIVSQFVPLTGGTMTGALTLAGPPTQPLHAATKAYAESLSGGATALLPDEYLLSSFGASGSKQTFTGTVSAGGTTLTITAGTPDFQVGQGILIKGAGSSSSAIPGALWTKVDAVAGNVITLHDATTSAVTAVANNVQHDDQAAVQAAIDFLYSIEGGTIIAEKGFYRLNGPLGSYTSLLSFPHIDIQTGVLVSITIRGTMPLPSPGFFGGTTNFGTIFQTDVHNTSASMLSGGTWIPAPIGYQSINNIVLFLENLTFRTYENPQISGLDLGMLKDIFLKQVCIDAEAHYNNAAPPTAVGTFGLRCPRDTASATGHILEIVWVQNYYIGVIFGEQMVCIKAYMMRCKIGVQFSYGYHQVVGHFVVCNCETGVYFPERCVVQLMVDVQNTVAASPGLALLRDFYDPNNLVTGYISYVVISTEYYDTAIPAVIEGLNRCVVVNLGDTSPTRIPSATVPQMTAGTMKTTGEFKVNGNFLLGDTVTPQPVSFGAADSAVAGKRHVQIPNAGTSTLLNGIVSYWKHNETTGVSADSTVAGNDLLLSGAATSEAGILNGATCRRVSGGGSFFCLDNPTLDFSANKSFTINGWINVATGNAGSGAPYPCLMSKADTSAAGGAEWYVAYNASVGGTGGWQFYAVTTSGVVAAELVTPLTYNTWYMVTAIFTFGTGLSVRINGGTPTTAAATAPLVHTATSLRALWWPWVGGTNARIDETGIWSRVLTGPEITSLYASGGGLPFPF